MSYTEPTKTTVRNDAIETICSNLIWSGIIQLSEVASHMVTLSKMSNIQLAETLIYSRIVLDEYLATCREVN